jgi:hypothetical protein
MTRASREIKHQARWNRLGVKCIALKARRTVGGQPPAIAARPTAQLPVAVQLLYLARVRDSGSLRQISRAKMHRTGCDSNTVGLAFSIYIWFTILHLYRPFLSSELVSPGAPSPSPPLPSSCSVMASVAGRKKSVMSPGRVQIEIPVDTNTLLNKAASQPTSLHQQCSALRSRLLRVQGFAHFFALSSSPTGSLRSSAEVVDTVWDCFALGTPLCYLFNLLPPPITPIDIETDPRSVDINNHRAKKRAIALFAIQVKQLNHGEQFTVTDLWDRTNPGGFVKVRFTFFFVLLSLLSDRQGC